MSGGGGRRGRRAFVTLALALVSLVASCTQNNAKITGDRDASSSADGAVTPASHAAHRVVSLSPSTTETLFAIGAGNLVVGRSRYCDYPPEVLKLPQVGGYVDPNLEAILAQKPDLVVGARGPAGRALVDTLEARGIATYFPETESEDAIEKMITGLGARTHTEDGARETLQKMRAKSDEVTREAKTKSRVRVLLVFGLEPIVVAGPSGFPNEMLSRVNAVNVVKEGAAYPTLSIEAIIALDPDVIVNAAIAESHGGQPIKKDAPGWSSVRAVREGHVAAIEDESVLRPGPRLGDGLAVLSRAVHGGP